MVSGPSQSGKSTLMFDMLRNPELIFSCKPQRIVYVYGAWQDSFDEFKNIEFVNNLDKIFEEDYFDRKTTNFLILDDVMEELSNNKKASRLFTKFSHHLNISIFFLMQNLFHRGLRDISLNCQYLLLFRSARDVGQIQLLGRQLGLRHLVQAYEVAIKEEYGYLFVNLHPKTPAILKLQSHLFGIRRVYLPK